MRFVRCATIGVAVAIGGTGAYAQSVISRTIDTEPVETTVMQGPNGTVITRRPLVTPVAPAAPVATEAGVRVGSATYMDETVGAAPRRRAATRTTTRIVHSARRESRTAARAENRTVHAVRHARAIVLAPAERQVIYRTIVQRQVVPSAVIPAPPPGYPPYPAPATTGYAVTTPAVDYDDVYAERVRPAYPVAPYTVGSVLPATVVLTPVPATVAVPAARPYSYATIDGRVLLVDPATYTVVADITP
ncbi:MAG TPA: DUF1236 domain-containing protein [Xanthobacteraceae bacterium]|nr:DUF1236 domain-containing protein [Xanthobacteraceae bacterium]